MATMRFDIEKFDGIKIFGLWQVRMFVILVQNGLKKTFKKTLIYGRDKLSFEDMKGNLLNKDKLHNDRAVENDEKGNEKVELADASVVEDKGDDDCWCLRPKVEGGVVLMWNNSSYKIISIGTVQIRMHNKIIRTLSGVRHVPDLKKNLISLSMLDLNDCRIIIESSSIKVSHGALVLMKVDSQQNIVRPLDGALSSLVALIDVKFCRDMTQDHALVHFSQDKLIPSMVQGSKQTSAFKAF
ncbi:Retrovirus-related Pol polyprotein from transposon TNT 1-94 [Gossypium australe]|uniref:Retrovirus-related Pol polyprotein from transposon TNT 1-94 n=1 Tax=Gossypium australe TaxID=47621 RepID=A0A5B6VEE6_9ROSI|nr:Retrovirus-related Pol polyprotein from transposon TNT 1-94 [Gossypium australe]